jgi:hypothetical protein
VGAVSGLTREQIEQATGRDLDALVAAHVLGCRVFRAQYEWSHRLECACPDKSHDDPRLGKLKAYSTDIAAAWEVFDTALFLHGGASINADMEDYGRGAFFGNGPERVVTVFIGLDDGWSVTAPVCEAICKAALYAAVKE